MDGLRPTNPLTTNQQTLLSGAAVAHGQLLFTCVNFHHMYAWHHVWILGDDQ
jgi:hypothetical protein